MIKMDEVLARAALPLLDVRGVLFLHNLELDRRVKHAASRDEVCMRMITVPGVGPIAALAFKSAAPNALLDLSPFGPRMDDGRGKIPMRVVYFPQGQSSSTCWRPRSFSVFMLSK